MSTDCPQTEATLAWLYGEGDEAQLEHIGGCERCQALCEEHEAVLAAVRPTMVATPPGLPEPANRPMWPVVLPGVALAAVALFAVLIFGGPPRTPPVVAPPVPVASVEMGDLDSLDLGLDDLDSELDDLFADLEVL